MYYALLCTLQPLQPDERVQDPLYVWLSTTALRGESPGMVMSIFDKIKKNGCDNQQDLVNLNFTRQEIESKMEIPFAASVRIAKSLWRSSVVEPLMPPIRSFTVAITKIQQLQSCKNIGDFRILDANILSKERDPLNSQYKTIKVAKVKVCSTQYSPSSDARLLYEHSMLLFLNSNNPGLFIDIYALMKCEDIELSSDCQPYPPFAKAMVMERGEFTLSEYLKRNEPNVGIKLEICIRLLDIVEAAHSNGIVLMDFKSDNIVFVKQNDACTSPWKAIDMEGCLTVGTSLAGADTRLTLAYMAPELFQRTPPEATFAMDVWSLSMITFEVYSRQKFFSSLGMTTDDSIQQYMHKLLNEAAVNPVKAQRRIDNVIDNAFNGQDNLRHFLKVGLSVDPSYRSSVTFLRQKSLITNRQSINASVLYSSLKSANEKLDQVNDKMDNLSTQVHDLTDNLARHYDDVKVKLDNVVSHSDLKEICKGLKDELKECLDCGLETITSETIDSVHSIVEESVTQGVTAIETHLDSLGAVVQDNAELNRQQVQLKSDDVLHAVEAIQHNVNVLIGQTELMSQKVCEIQSELICDNLKSFLHSEVIQSEEDLKNSLCQLLEKKCGEMETMFKSSNDENTIKAIKEAMKELYKPETQETMLQEISTSLKSLRDVQRDLIYGVHTVPFLPVVWRPKLKGLKMKCKSFFCEIVEVDFLCTVCGRPGKSSVDGKGLQVSLIKEWVKVLAECILFTAEAIEVGAHVAGSPVVPRVSSRIKPLTDSIPEDVLNVLTEAMEELIGFTSANDMTSIIDGTSHHVNNAPEISPDHARKMKMLLATLGVKNFEKTGLQKAIRPSDEKCTWVCASKGRKCKEAFMEHGDASLLIKIKLN